VRLAYPEFSCLKLRKEGGYRGPAEGGKRRWTYQQPGR